MKIERYAEAVDDFTVLLSMDPTSVETYYKRGIDATGLMLPPLSLYCLLVYIPRDATFCFAGVTYTKLGAQDAAIADFTKVLGLNADHVNAAFSRAACYNTIGQFSRAIEDYNTALLKDQSIVSMSGSRPGTPNTKPVASRYPSIEGKRDRGLRPPSSADHLVPVANSGTASSSNGTRGGGAGADGGVSLSSPHSRSPVPQRTETTSPSPAYSSRSYPLAGDGGEHFEPLLPRREYGHNHHHPLPSPPRTREDHTVKRARMRMTTITALSSVASHS